MFLVNSIKDPLILLRVSLSILVASCSIVNYFIDPNPLSRSISTLSRLKMCGRVLGDGNF